MLAGGETLVQVCAPERLGIALCDFVAESGAVCARVGEVLPGSAADEAGVWPMDAIASVDGINVMSHTIDVVGAALRAATETAAQIDAMNPDAPHALISIAFTRPLISSSCTAEQHQLHASSYSSSAAPTEEVERDWRGGAYAPQSVWQLEHRAKQQEQWEQWERQQQSEQRGGSSGSLHGSPRERMGSSSPARSRPGGQISDGERLQLLRSPEAWRGGQSPLQRDWSPQHGLRSLDQLVATPDGTWRNGASGSDGWQPPGGAWEAATPSQEQSPQHMRIGRLAPGETVHVSRRGSISIDLPAGSPQRPRFGEGRDAATLRADTAPANDAWLEIMERDSRARQLHALVEKVSRAELGAAHRALPPIFSGERHPRYESAHVSWQNRGIEFSDLRLPFEGSV